MSKGEKNTYQQIDKIAGVSWSFIKLVCNRHDDTHPWLVLENGSSGPHYQCENKACSLTFPAVVHERLLDEVIKILNIKGGLTVLHTGKTKPPAPHIISGRTKLREHLLKSLIGMLSRLLKLKKCFGTLKNSLNRIEKHN